MQFSIKKKLGRQYGKMLPGVGSEYLYAPHTWYSHMYLYKRVGISSVLHEITQRKWFLFCSNLKKSHRLSWWLAVCVWMCVCVCVWLCGELLQTPFLISSSWTRLTFLFLYFSHIHPLSLSLSLLSLHLCTMFIGQLHRRRNPWPDGQEA